MLLSAPVQGFGLEGRGRGGGWGFYLFIGRFSASSLLRLCEEGKGLEEWSPLPDTNTHICVYTPFLPCWPCSLPRGTPLRQSTLTSIRAWCSGGGRDCPTESHVHAWILKHVHTKGKVHTKAPHLVMFPSPHCRSHLPFYLFQIGLVSREPSNVSVTQVHALPYLITRRIWTSLNKHLKTVGKQTEQTEDRRRGESFREWRLRWRIVLISSPLCVKFWAVCCLVISFAHRIGGELRLRLDERGISLTKCFYNKAQTPSNPTHSHTLVSFSCTELPCDKKCPHLSKTHIALIFYSFKSLRIFEKLALISKIGLYSLGLDWYVCKCGFLCVCVGVCTWLFIGGLHCSYAEGCRLFLIHYADLDSTIRHMEERERCCCMSAHVSTSHYPICLTLMCYKILPWKIILTDSHQTAHL